MKLVNYWDCTDMHGQQNVKKYDFFHTYFNQRCKDTIFPVLNVTALDLWKWLRDTLVFESRNNP